ncbi:hypothetical protein [Cupriavidus plantarum]|uniref:hypothetical protein n=1 Tax=Cupriavidus plantarum TaxID=942865 RepID=UPI00339D88E8
MAASGNRAVTFMPNAQLILYPDANHGSFYQYPALFVAQAEQFLSWGLPDGSSGEGRTAFPAEPPRA